MSGELKSEELAAPTSENQKGLSLFWGTAGALAIGIILWFADASSALSPYSATRDSPYNLLVQGFRAGHLYLNRQPPPALARLSHPFNPAIEARDAGDVADMSYYQGRIYLYFGVTPALVLYWPYVVVTGHYLSDKAAVIIFLLPVF